MTIKGIGSILISVTTILYFKTSFFVLVLQRLIKIDIFEQDCAQCKIGYTIQNT